MMPLNGLKIEHYPNPTNWHSSPLHLKRRFPYTWFYRTEVTNSLSQPLKIVQFESYFWNGRRWVARNILRRPLDTEVFLRWYGQEDGANDGWLSPGKKAVCDVNWHGSNSPHAPKVKWVFYAVDEQGFVHEGEGEIISLSYPANSPEMN